MTDSYTAREVAALLAFAPAPSAARHDGWSPERQRRFVIALRSFGCVAKAARAVSASAAGAYALRKRPGAEGFAAAWDRALDAARLDQFERLMERARTPQVTPLHRGGRFHSLRTGHDNQAGIAAVKLADKLAAEGQRTGFHLRGNDGQRGHAQS